jgi:predicted DCC family thiol-disulfide oxidoreductase YuxK
MPPVPPPPSSPPPLAWPAPGAVVLFDGECGLCQRIVRMLLRLDSAGRLSFAPLQSAPAQYFLRRHGLPTRDCDSLVFVPAWSSTATVAYQVRTDGICAALAQLERPWRFLAAMRFLPRPVRDGVYRLVARFRYALFGRARPTPLPNPDWARRFLAR